MHEKTSATVSPAKVCAFMGCPPGLKISMAKKKVRRQDRLGARIESSSDSFHIVDRASNVSG